MTKREAVFSKDLQQKKLTVVRSFGASLERVWKAWTDSAILDQWWAPRPYRAATKTMDFREGGYWLYRMIGPQGDSNWCRVDYHEIAAPEKVRSTAGFCDENGNLNAGFPAMHWTQLFSHSGDDTTVTVEITFDKDADMETIIGMGFQEGFTAGLNNLDEYFNGQ